MDTSHMTSGRAEEEGRRAWRLGDCLFLAALIALGAYVAVPGLGAAPFPAEDAAMLMRYSEHVALGHGIVWNIGEGPVEGGTDFLVLMTIAGLIKLGLGALAATRLLNLGAHLATLSLMYVAARRLWGVAPWLAALAPAYLAVGIAVFYVAAGFSAPVFTLFMLTTWLAGVRASEGPESWQRGVLFGLVALLTALVRPEGVMFGAFCLIGVVVQRGGIAKARVTMLTFIAVCLALGSAYFVWRWRYFGFLLPLPYYRKGGGTLHLQSLQSTFNAYSFLIGPMAPLLLAGVIDVRTRRYAASALVPILGFLVIWILMTNEQNYFTRYQYPITPIAGVAAGVILSRIAPAWTAARLDLGRAAIGLLVVGLFWKHWTGPAQRRPSLETPDRGLYQVATLLNKYAGKGYTVAVSEGGILPFFSRWRAIDGWGLNDPWIALHHEISEEYLDRYKPEVIMYESLPSDPPAWWRMVETLERYARKRGYVRAGDFRGTLQETHSYWVKPDFADSAAIATAIAGLDYGLDHRINVVALPGFYDTAFGAIEHGPVGARWK